jgi:hypothetical protein
MAVTDSSTAMTTTTITEEKNTRGFVTVFIHFDYVLVNSFNLLLIFASTT